MIRHDRLASGFVFIIPGDPPPPFCRDQNCLVYPLLSPRMHYSSGVISTNGSLIFRLSHQTFFSPSARRPPRLRFTLLLPAAITTPAGAALTGCPFAVHHLLRASLLLSPPANSPRSLAAAKSMSELPRAFFFPASSQGRRIRRRKRRRRKNSFHWTI